MIINQRYSCLGSSICLTHKYSVSLQHSNYNIFCYASAIHPTAKAEQAWFGLSGAISVIELSFQFECFPTELVDTEQSCRYIDQRYTNDDRHIDVDIDLIKHNIHVREHVDTELNE